MTMNRSIVTGVLLFTLGFNAGCFIVHTDKHVRESGVPVSSQTLNQIKTGETTEAWLLATLGEPSDRTVVDEDESKVKILRYDHTVHKSDEGRVFLLFSGETDETKIRRAYFEIKNGVVTRYWTDP